MLGPADIIDDGQRKRVLMRGMRVMAVCLVLCLLVAIPAAAQDTTPEPITKDDIATGIARMDASATQIAVGMDEVEKGVTETQNGVNYAFSLLGIFEAIGFF